MSPKVFPDFRDVPQKVGLSAFLLQCERSMRDAPVGTQVLHCSSSRYHQRWLSSPTSGPGIKQLLRRAQNTAQASQGQWLSSQGQEHGSEPARLAKVSRQK